MCGIAGIVGKEIASSGQNIVLNQMLNTIAHRGPDAKGVLVEGKVGLGHRRLSILDLSEQANQPMHSAGKRYVIVFNGEIYNFRELIYKYKLTPRTTSDTEVFLELFAIRKLQILEELNGMFAAAIWDREEEKLYIVKDRYGKKPLYYLQQDGLLYFASELKAIASLIKNPAIDRDAVRNFLHLGYIPSPQSIYKQVRKLGPGEYLISSKEKIEVKKWYNLSEHINTETINSEKEALASLESLVADSVKLRMNSDVPFGAFLSGGIDSSLIAAFASQIGIGKLNTFSIGFEDTSFDESFHAKAIANFLHANHNELIVKEQDALQHLETIMDHFDEPFSDSSALPFYLVSSLAKKHVTMALSGDGGDELFMGYGAYTWANRLTNPLIQLTGPVVSKALLALGNNRLQRAARMFGQSDNPQSLIFSQEQYLFSQNEINKVLNFSGSEFPKMGFNTARKLSAREKQALFDMSYYLPDDLLVKVDRTSMLCGLEARCPLLDFRIVEFAMNLSENLKVKNGESKYLLKKLLYERIPAKYFQRPKKGFSIPLKDWLKGELGYMIEDNLNSKALEITGMFNDMEVNRLKKDFLQGKDFLYNRIWTICLLQRWMLKHNVYVR